MNLGEPVPKLSFPVSLLFLKLSECQLLIEHDHAAVVKRVDGTLRLVSSSWKVVSYLLLRGRAGGGNLITTGLPFDTAGRYTVLSMVLAPAIDRSLELRLGKR